MNRQTVLEAMYEILQDSMEWADNYKETYHTFVDGVLTMTDAILDKEKENTEE